MKSVLLLLILSATCTAQQTNGPAPIGQPVALMTSYSSAATTAIHWHDAAIQVSVSELSVEERRRVQEALDAWRPYSPLVLSLVTDVCSRCITIRREQIADKELGESEIDHTDRLIDGVTIRVAPRAGSGDSFEHTIEHEIGHALGLIEHRPKSVMSATWSGHHPGEADGALLRAMYEPQTTSVLRYSFRRVASDGKRTRNSKFVIGDTGALVEAEWSGSNDKKFLQLPVFPIGEHPAAPRDWYVAWTDEISGYAGRDVPWFKEETKSGLLFPFEAKKGKIQIRFYDYQLFRVSSTVKEVDDQ